MLSCVTSQTEDVAARGSAGLTNEENCLSQRTRLKNASFEVGIQVSNSSLWQYLYAVIKGTWSGSQSTVWWLTTRQVLVIP